MKLHGGDLKVDNPLLKAIQNNMCTKLRGEAGLYLQFATDAALKIFRAERSSSREVTGRPARVSELFRRLFLLIAK
jgi:hypothetical protein